jgi:hypothetical protein
LHDDLQCGGGELSNNLHRSRHTAYGRCDYDQQRDREHRVLVELQHDADRVSHELRATIPFAITIFRSETSAAALRPG